MPRQTKRILIIGTNGTGKTTFARKIVDIELKRTAGRVLVVVAPDGADWLEFPRINIYKKGRLDEFSGGWRHIWKDKDDLEFLKHFKNGLLVFDDCRAYFDAKVNTNLQNFFIRSRQRQIDILSVAHGFTKVPPAFFAYATEIVLFKTRDAIQNRKNDLGNNYELLLAEKQHVDYMALKDIHYKKIIKY